MMRAAAVREIKMAIQAGDHARALQLLSPLLHDNPDAEVWYLAAKLAKTEDEAIRCLNRALMIDPHHADSLTMIAMLGGARQSFVKTITSELAALHARHESVFFKNMDPRRRSILLGGIAAAIVLGFILVIATMARPGSVAVASEGPTAVPVHLLTADAVLAELPLEETGAAQVERFDAPQKHVIRLSIEDEGTTQPVEIWVYSSIAALIEDRAELQARENANRVRAVANAVLIYPEQLSARYASQLEFAFNAFQSNS